MQTFHDACASRDFDKARAVFQLGGETHAHVRRLFPEACYTGDLVVAQWLFGLGGVDIHAEDDEVFRWACANGHLDVAQWLLSLGGVDIHAKYDEAFRWTCHGGHLVVAKWLAGLGCDMHAHHDLAFQWACAQGHLGLGRWLIAMDPSRDWPSEGLRALQMWSKPRDVWMRTVLTFRGMVGH
jgi:hypothetical protein